MATIQTPDLPGGASRLSSGLIVSKDLADSVLTEFNKQLVSVQDSTDTNSLILSIQEAYINATRQEKDGTITYKSKLSDSEAEILAQQVVEAVGYHIHIREYGMPPALVKQLKKATSTATGKSYLEDKVRSVVGESADNLATKFKGRITPQKVFEVAGELSEGYNARIVQELLQKEYGEDQQKYKDGLVNLNKVFHFYPVERLETNLAQSGLGNLVNLYVRFVLSGKDKM